MTPPDLTQPQRLDHAEEPRGLCDRCGERPATVRWGEGVTMIARGYYENWCERCATEVQLDHARNRAKAIPKLEETLRKEGGPASKAQIAKRTRQRRAERERRIRQAMTMTTT